MNGAAFNRWVELKRATTVVLEESLAWLDSIAQQRTSETCCLESIDVLTKPEQLKDDMFESPLGGKIHLAESQTIIREQKCQWTG